MTHILAGASAIAIVLLGVGVSVEAAEADRARDLADAERSLSDRLVRATVALEAGLGATIDLAEGGPTPSLPAAAAASVPGATGARFHPAEAGAGELAVVLDRARDSAEPQIASVAPGRVELVTAVYEEAPDGPGTLLTTAERRDALTGWIVVTIDPGALPGFERGNDELVRVVDGSTVLVSSDPAITEAPVGDVEADGDIAVAGRRWEATLLTAPGDASDLRWLAPVAALVIAAAVVMTIVRSDRRRRIAQEQLDRQHRRVRVISQIAPIVQQSLDLGEVLPAVAVLLTEHFGLAGITVSGVGGEGGALDLFTAGRPTEEVSLRARLPETLGRGQPYGLALERGGRTVAALRLTAGEPLDRSDLESLAAVAELVAAAVVNARLFERQQEAVHQFRELDELKTVFLGTASHELRTPVTAIAGFAGLMHDKWDDLDDDRRRTFAGRIDANARALDNLVQDLLDFSRLEQGTMAVALTDVDLVHVVERVVDRIRPALGDHPVRTELTAVSPVSADPNGVERMITNLVSNAAKFSPDGAPITIEVQPSPKGARLVVDDEGPGVPADERDRIFSRFFRGSGEAVVRTRGVGIGLSVVREFAEAMGATIEVTDAPDGGARFVIDFRAEALGRSDPEEALGAPS